MKASILLALLLALAGRSQAQSLPPDIYWTNTFTLQIWYATDGVHYTNFWGASSDQNVSTNIPWDNGYFHNPPGSPWAWVTGYPTNLIKIFWTWGHANMSTNFLMVTNDPATTMGTLLTFYVYPPIGTNAVTQYVGYHTDGNTLSFAHNLAGPWTWSGSPNYREPNYYLIYPFVRGVSTDGSVNPVHLWQTNEFWMDGVLIRKQVITQ